MKFTKLAKSDKFEYMLLSRLIQDAKYFIDYPDLKHLWARTLDEHIKQMKEQYAKLDPKPEWTSEEEINSLAKQMKESYTNHWNEVHPNNKIEASDNFKVGDKVFFDTLYEFQEDDLGFNYDRGILKEIKHWPSNNREYYIVQTDDGKLLQVGYVFHTEEDMEAFRNNWMNPKFEKESKKKDKEYIIHFRSEKEQEADSDFHTYKVLKDKKSAIELAKDLFKKMNYEGQVSVDSGDYSYYSTDDYDWDKINKMNSKDYKNGYRDGKDDYKIGHPADPDDLKDNFSEEYIEGYWQGFDDAQEKEFYKQSAIIQPNKPKPTTMLPDNMQWAWDPDAADWVAVLKDNDNTTPPLYDPNNQNTVNNTTTYMSTIKSASKKTPEEIADKIIKTYSDEEEIEILKEFAREMKREPIALFNNMVEKAAKQWELNPREIMKCISNKDKQLLKKIVDLTIDENKKDLDEAISKLSSQKISCLEAFLDGPIYSKDLKIEAGLIKEGLVKYAGFDFNRGTKYAITTTGLDVLKRAFEIEYNEAQNKREKLAYLFGFNTDKETTLDTTGHYIKGAKKFTICEADGTELGEVEALDEIDAKVKFGIEHPEYADSQSIKAICASEGKIFNVEYSYPDSESNVWYRGSVKVKANTEEEALKIAEEKLQGADTFKISNKSYSNDDLITKDSPVKTFRMDWYYDGERVRNEYTDSKEVESQYEQTTEQHLDYPNPSETPHTDVIIENHDGWVNTASFEDDIRKQFQQPHQKLPNSDRDLALLEKQILEITDEDTRDTIRKIFDEFQFSDKEAAGKRPYTEEEKRLLPLFKLLNEYVARKEITLEETPDNQLGIVVTGQAEVINDLEHKVKDLGFHCEPIAEITDEDYIGYDIYSLKIFYK